MIGEFCVRDLASKIEDMSKVRSEEWKGGAILDVGPVSFLCSFECFCF